MSKNNLKKIYIDIDGVLIGKLNKNSTETNIALYTKEFLDFCLKNFKCYWLSSFSKSGELSPVVKRFKNYDAFYLLKKIKLIRPLIWNILKTEAIDFNSNFYWIDDRLLKAEKRELQKHNSLDRLIKVDTRVEPEGLKKVLSIIRNKIA